MVDGLRIPTWNKTKKPLAIALSGAGRQGRDDGGDITNVHISLIRIVIMNPLLHNEYIIIKKF
jgi:hypothetical protein